MKRENAAGRAADLATAERALSTLRSSAAALMDTGCDEVAPYHTQALRSHPRGSVKDKRAGEFVQCPARE